MTESAPASVEPSTIFPFERSDSHSVRRENQILDQVQTNHDRIVFIGDSNIECWSTIGQESRSKTIAPNFGTANFGVSSETTESLPWRLGTGELARYPDVVVLEIGTNNVLWNNETPNPDVYSIKIVSDTAAGISAVVETISKISLETKILLLGIVPLGAKSSDPHLREVDTINTQLANLSNTSSANVQFRNVDGVLLNPDGSRPSSPDGVHMNSSQYAILENAISGPLRNLEISQIPVVENVRITDANPHQSELVLSFNLPLDAGRATDLNNDHLVRLDHGGMPASWCRPSSIASAIYDANSKSITLVPSHRLHSKTYYQITVNGLGPSGLASARDTLLDGEGHGEPGSDYVTVFQGYTPPP